MSSDVLSVAQQTKRLIYVGGFGEEVDGKVLHALFVPFGEVVDVTLPMDYEKNAHRGFAFIEFESAEDAAAAIDNMNESELFGRTLRVAPARPIWQSKHTGRAVWNWNEWLTQYAGATLKPPSASEEAELESQTQGGAESATDSIPKRATPPADSEKQP